MLDKQILDAIEYYKQQGFSPIPVKYRSKKLNLSKDEWDLSKTIDEKQIKIWMDQGKYENIGLLVGPPSKNLTVIDIDKTRYIPIDFITEQLNYDDRKIGYLVKTHRGFQLWFKNKPNMYDRNEKIPDYGIEFFSEKQMIVVPPSIHPDGTQYKFIHKPDWFKPTNVNFIWNNIKVYCISHDMDQVLKPIMNPITKQQIIEHIKNPDCSHNARLWVVGFFYTCLNLEKKDILQFINQHHKWTDYNSEKTEYFVSRQIEYIDKKVGKKGGQN